MDQTIEDYCSGKFFVRKGKTDKEFLAEAGDAYALEVFSEYGCHLGAAFKLMLYTLSPQAIFLGGSIGNCYPFFKDAMINSLSTFPFRLGLDKLAIEVSNLNNAAILGAAALFKMKMEKILKLRECGCDYSNCIYLST